MKKVRLQIKQSEVRRGPWYIYLRGTLPDPPQVLQEIQFPKSPDFPPRGPPLYVGQSGHGPVFVNHLTSSGEKFLNEANDRLRTRGLTMSWCHTRCRADTHVLLLRSE